MKHCFTLFILSLFISIGTFFSGPASAATPFNVAFDCDVWTVEDMGPARCRIVDEGCRISISGNPFTLYSAVKLPRRTRYLLNWNVGLETTLEAGAAGLALGNDYSGLIFQVRKGGFAEILSYLEGQDPRVKMSRKLKTKGPEYSLDVAVDIAGKQVDFTVNGDEVFSVSSREGGDLHIPSSIKNLAVTTRIPNDGEAEALALHRKVRIRAE